MTTKLDAVKTTFMTGALILGQTIGLSPLPVSAADNSVRIAGQPVFSVSASGGLTAEKRAETVQNNLDNALVAAKDKSPSAVNITYVKGMPIVTVGGYQVITVDAASAKAAGTTPAVLAQKWADGIRSSLQDQSSVNSYVSQLSGNYTASAPPVANRTSSMSVETPQADQIPPPTYNNANANAPQSAQYQAPSAPYQNAQYQQPGPGYGAQTQTQPPVYGGEQYGGPQGGGLRQGRVAYAPAGLSMPISLQTAISTQVAKAGDLIEAQISENMNLGDSSIPAGSTVVGTITDADPGRRLSRSGKLSIKFNRLRTPDGIETPISAHLVGGIGKYTDVGSDQSDTVRGEGWKAKLGQTAIRGGAGAGLGAALGTAVGAIAGRSGTAVGRGAWGGAAIGGGVGAADMLLRKGRDVVIPSGTHMQLQLDAPATIAGGNGGQPAAAMPYTGNL